jgi:hypothetical protein
MGTFYLWEDKLHAQTEARGYFNNQLISVVDKL